MAELIELLEFSKDWRNPTDFPTYESSETQVREDMQFLHNETRQYINTKLLTAFSKAVDDLFAEVDEKIEETVAGQIPDNTITVAKIKSDAIANNDSANDSALASAGYLRDKALPRVLVPGRDVGEVLPSNPVENQLFFLILPED